MKKTLELSSLFYAKTQTLDNEELLHLKLRPYQQADYDKFYQEGNENKALYLCYARRLGKDALALHIAFETCINKPNARVYYMFPYAAQARKVILEGVTLDAQPMISALVNPKVLKLPRNGKLYHYDNSIRFKNGSIIQFIGADADANVGTNCHLFVVSEAGLIGDKKQIEYIVPNVIKAKGRVIIVSSPRFASWFNEDLLTKTDDQIIKGHVRARDAFDNDGNRVYTDEELEAARAIMSEIRFRSEYEVDLTVEEEDSIYARSLNMAKTKDNYTIANKRVFVGLDAGISDKTSMVFGTIDNANTIEIVHHYHNNGQASEHYSDYLKQWCYDNKINPQSVTLVLPHDMKNRVDAGRYLTSRVAFYQGQGWHCIVMSPIDIFRSIEITRTALEKGDCIICNNSSTAHMVNMMKMYEWKKAPVTKECTYVPDHGRKGYSDICDSFEALMVCLFLDKYERTMVRESGVIRKS